MLEEPWITFLLLFFSATGVIAIAFADMWLQDRAAARRQRDASIHPAE